MADGYGQDQAAGGKDRARRATWREEAISAKKVAGAKDVVPRTAIDLIRALLPDSFSVRRPFRAPPMRCRPLLGPHSLALRPAVPPSILPRGFLI